MFRELVETIRKDITNVRPEIVKRGLSVARHSAGLSKSKLRKLGLIDNPWRKTKPPGKSNR